MFIYMFLRQILQISVAHAVNVRNGQRDRLRVVFARLFSYFNRYQLMKHVEKKKTI